MNNTNFNDPNRAKFKRTPFKHVLIEDLSAGVWDEGEKELATRYGKIRRARICGTVVNKREIEEQESRQSIVANDKASNSRVSFQIDDGTGNIWATMWGAPPSQYAYLKNGTLVDVVGILRVYKSNPQMTIDFIHPIEDPNYEIYHIAEVLRKRKFDPKIKVERTDRPSFNDFDNEEGEQNDTSANPLPEKVTIIPEKPAIVKKESETKTPRKKSTKIAHESSNIEENVDTEAKSTLPSQYEVGGELNKKAVQESKGRIPISTSNNIFEGEGLSDQILQYIKDNDAGDGVAMDAIAKKINIGMDELKIKLDQLCQNIKIYKVQPGFFSAY